MNQNKMTAPVQQHRNGRKARETYTKTRTTILLAAAGICNWLVGEIGLAALMIFGLPPLVGLAPWLPLPLLGGAVLTVSAGLMEEVLECADAEEKF